MPPKPKFQSTKLANTSFQKDLCQDCYGNSVLHRGGKPGPQNHHPMKHRFLRERQRGLRGAGRVSRVSRDSRPRGHRKFWLLDHKSTHIHDLRKIGLVQGIALEPVGSDRFEAIPGFSSLTPSSYHHHGLPLYGPPGEGTAPPPSAFLESVCLSQER